MNPFVNINKRGVELPKGCKDLIDVLKRNRPQRIESITCQYCGATAIATLDLPLDYRWCTDCLRDLCDFAKIEIATYGHTLKSDQPSVSIYQNQVQQRQDNFMAQRVKERKQK